VEVYIVHCHGCRVEQRGFSLSQERLDAKGKRALAEKLLAQAAEDDAKEPIPR
jgi:hypothetical protein